MIAVRSLAFTVLFFAWTALLLIMSLPLLALPRRWLLMAARVWARGTLGLLAGICDLHHEIRGLSHLPPGPCIVASKHQSAWDTIIFHLLIEDPCYIFKKELMWLVPLGWLVKHTGGIPIDRKGGAVALKGMIRMARRRLQDGRVIIIFPEGTRMPPGAHRAYHPGTAALYTQLGVPVVPVALNSGLFWGRRSLIKKPGVITIEFLPPIPPGLPRKTFAAELERRIEEASNRLLGAAGAPPTPSRARASPTV